jgi:flagellar basal body-associated protein FliL
MALGWVILGAIGVVLLCALLFIVSRMAKEREAARRRKQAAMAPLAQDTITYAGHS